jgi:uncharacterized protein
VFIVALVTSACSKSLRTAPTPGGPATSERVAPRDVPPPSLAAGFPLPAPRGHVNDFAGVIPDSTTLELELTLRILRTTTAGEVAIVTFADLAGAKVEEVARRIGNEWGIGASTGVARNAGTVVVLIPKESAADGVGRCRIELGTGAAAFISDSMAQSMCVGATPQFRKREYAAGLRSIVQDLVRRYEARFRNPVERN